MVHLYYSWPGLGTKEKNQWQSEFDRAVPFADDMTGRLEDHLHLKSRGERENVQ
jgi:hypothetical protein